MRRWAALAMAAALWGCDAQAPPAASPPAKVSGPSTTATVKIDDV